MARADYTAISKDSNTQQPQQTGAGGHTRQASSVSNDQISPKRATSAPPEEEKSTRDTETTIEHRPGFGALIGTGTLRGDCERSEQKHATATTNRRVGTLDKHLPSPTTKFSRNAPPAPHQKKKRAPETHKRRSKTDPDWGLPVWHGLSARRLRKMNRNA